MRRFLCGFLGAFLGGAGGGTAGYAVGFASLPPDAWSGDGIRVVVDMIAGAMLGAVAGAGAGITFRCLWERGGAARPVTQTACGATEGGVWPPPPSGP